MPELLIDFITSLDGCAAADGWPGWWGLEGPEYLAWLGEQPEARYMVLMGATTYRLMSGLAADGEPGTDAHAVMSKVVFSTTLSEVAWANTQLVSRDPVEAVREMKDKGSRSMRTIGSLTLCRSLLTAGLVARFRVVVFPVSRESAVGSESTTATRALLLTWQAAAPSTVASNSSSTFLRFWLVRPEPPTSIPDRTTGESTPLRPPPQRGCIDGSCATRRALERSVATALPRTDSTCRRA